MLITARRLLLNFGPRALTGLGFLTYLRMLLLTLRHAPAILRERDLVPLDRAMGTRPLTIRYRGQRICLDAPTVDGLIDDGTFVFGIVRELMIRDCYFRLHPPGLYADVRTVVDVGANRGIFSLLVSPVAERVIGVDMQLQMLESIRAVMEYAGYSGHTSVCTFIGRGGLAESGARDRMSMAELFDTYGLDTVDLVKFDIEGSEFALFEDSAWIDRVAAISMEIHPEYGEVQAVLDTLTAHGFAHTHVDHLFRRVGDPQQASFVHAHHPERVKP